MPDKPMTYASTGVSYDSMDPFKRACQKRAARTANNASRLGVEPLEWTRGESVYVVRLRWGQTAPLYIGHVEEGLGTKNLVANAYRQLRIAKKLQEITGKTYYDQIAQCTVATIVNDMATLNIKPVGIAMHAAAGSSECFADEARNADLIEGWGNVCDIARAIWDGGETPTLKGLIDPDGIVLAGSSWGVSDVIFNPANIQNEDVIVFLESSGIHANGLTLARSIADKLPNGYATLLPDGRMYGEVLLEPTHIYSDFVEDCERYGVEIHYAVNITGHGWRKLMRAEQLFTYSINELPPSLHIFPFIQEYGLVTNEEAYGNLNMGAGYAFFMRESSWLQLVDTYNVNGYDKKSRFRPHKVGRVLASQEKRVVIIPVKDSKGNTLEFKADSLAVR